jgi:hypothetical protein
VSADPYAPVPQPPASTEAVVALILGIIGLLGALGSCCCCLSLVVALCSPVAAFLGYRERLAIREGRSSPGGEGLATAGMVMGIVGTAIMILYLIGLLIYGLVVGFGAMADKMRGGGSLLR